MATVTNKDRLCERSEPQSYPVVGQARHGKQGSYIKANIFFDSEGSYIRNGRVVFFKASKIT